MGYQLCLINALVIIKPQRGVGVAAIELENKTRIRRFLKMPFGVFGSGSSIKFSKKRTYSVQHNLENGGTNSLGRRRSSAPAGILKKSGRSSRPTSYPALAEGMVPSEMAAAVPMPSEAEVNMMFSQMVVS